MKRYVKADGLGEDFDVFMLMEYTADTGPDTMGMEGDGFYCLGKFFAKDLATAKKELEAIKNKYPWLKKMSQGYTHCDIYVDEYNDYFDYSPESEDDIDMNPSAWGGAEYNVFPDLATLIEYLGYTDERRFCYENNIDVDLPFELSADEEVANYEVDKFLKDVVREFHETLHLDPDYSDVWEKVEKVVPEVDGDCIRTDIVFWDGDYCEGWRVYVSELPHTLDRAVDYMCKQFVNNFIKE